VNVPPSGEQYEIRCGDQWATIVEVGGGVRSYRHGERDVLDPYPVSAMCDGAHGTPLIPWPNRLADGRYRFDGTDYQVALTEPARHNAIHGFLRWRPWRPSEVAQDRVVMTTRLYPMSGYPFTVDVAIAYALSDEGLTVTTTATNIGDAACPFAMGQHPYLSPGAGPIDECTLQVDARTRIIAGEDRLLPVGTEPVDATPYDFGTPRRLGALQMDAAFTDLVRDASGRAWVRLTGPDRRCAALWVDERYPVIELFTGDSLPPDRRRLGLGTEPMSAPPNAFQTGEHLVRLAPGQSVTGVWGVLLS